MEDYKEKYEKLYRFMNDLYPYMSDYCKEKVDGYFPELKESEDERIWTINYLNNRKLNSSIIEEKESLKRAIAWLERQGEQNPANKVEPKFKVGDWVVYNRNDSSREIIQVYDIRDGRYYFTDNVHFSWSIKECDEKAHLWTIQDAKDGDVLTWDDSKCIALFKEIYNKHSFKSHGCIGACTAVFENWEFHYIENAHPSTKEQRDLLFQKMKEAGYEWDAEKKELKKIEQKPTQEINPFKAEHGKYYYCIKDYFCGGKKQASKGDVVQALRGLPIMGLEDTSEYFLPVTNVQNPAWSEEDEPQKELAETYLAVFDKKFPILPTLKGKKLADYKNFLNKCQQILGLKYWSIRPLQAKLFEKLSLLWAAWGAEHLKSLGQTNEDTNNKNHAWSEEDENMLQKTISTIMYALSIPFGKEDDPCFAGSSTISWLKFLKDRYTWKPSDEQMKALEYYIEKDIIDKEGIFGRHIIELYAQLKKLK